MIAAITVGITKRLLSYVEKLDKSKSGANMPTFIFLFNIYSSLLIWFSIALIVVLALPGLSIFCIHSLI